MSVVDIHDELRRRDFRRIGSFEMPGLQPGVCERFYMYLHEGNEHMVILQVYPDSDGWQLWRPVCEENDVQKTLYELGKWLHGDQIPDDEL